jgi:transcriptional regulator with XRE-family HTH domain
MSKTPRPPSFTEIQEQIGDRIRQVRELYGIEQAELARALEVDPSTLNKIEKGKRAPSVFNIISLASRLRVSTDFLLRGSWCPRLTKKLPFSLLPDSQIWCRPFAR